MITKSLLKIRSNWFPSPVFTVLALATLLISVNTYVYKWFNPLYLLKIFTPILAAITTPFSLQTKCTIDTNGWIHDVGFSNDDRLLAMAGRYTPIQLYDQDSPCPYSPMINTSGEWLCMTFDPKWPSLATGGIDGSVIFFNLTDQAQPQPVSPALHNTNQSILSMTFHPSMPLLVFGGGDGIIRIYNQDSKTTTSIYPPAELQERLNNQVDDIVYRHIDTVRDLEFDSEGQNLAVA